MKYIKTFERYNNFNEVTDIDNDYKTTDNKWFFIRVTNDPKGDLQRGFSCQAGCWVDDYEDAIKRQEQAGALIKPQQDPVTKGWCYDPELGISSFGFNTKEGFIHCVTKIEDYIHGEDDEIYVFTSKNFSLESGLDGEDVFRDGTLVGKLDISFNYGDGNIKILQSYDDILSMTATE